MAKHHFGGSWTERKLEALREYLIQYQIIFTKNPNASKLRTIYVDAFAGTGERDVNEQAEQPQLFGYDEEIRSYQDGSVRKALSLENKFHQYVFIDNKPKHASALQKLIRTEFAALADRCVIKQEDANRWLQEWCRTQDWKAQRAVVFLDPYGMSVEWETIEAIARTKAIDLWVLFPFAIGANRMMPKDALPDSIWSERLTAIFGTEEWKRRCYREDRELDLLGDTPGSVVKIAGMDDILAFFLERLGSVFEKVVERPLILENSKHTPMYALCFAAGNPRGAPTAVRIASYLTRA
ncbi:MAG: three-Cys-motif partner protein TcmP [Burkholderiales bacterium]